MGRAKYRPYGLTAMSPLISIAQSTRSWIQRLVVGSVQGSKQFFMFSLRISMELRKLICLDIRALKACLAYLISYLQDD